MNISRITINNYITQVADEVLRIWKRAPVPTRCRHHVVEIARQLGPKRTTYIKVGNPNVSLWVAQLMQR